MQKRDRKNRNPHDEDPQHLVLGLEMKKEAQREREAVLRCTVSCQACAEIRIRCERAHSEPRRAPEDNASADSRVKWRPAESARHTVQLALDQGREDHRADNVHGICRPQSG